MSKKVLLIEDEADISIFVKDFLERYDLQVFAALSGEEAILIFDKEKPEICFIDIHMPFSEFDGIEVLRRIKQKEKNTVCVMITRIDDEIKIKEAQTLGTLDYLIKPISLEKIKKLVEKIK